MKFDSKEQLLNAIRKDIIGELEAINQYSMHASMTDDPVAKAIWIHIKDEEQVHVGELLTLLTYFDPKVVEFLAEGEKEAKEIIRDIKG